MVKAHDQSLIPATAEGVKMQMVSAEVKAVWESDAGHAADGCYQPLISVAAGSDAPVCHRWECGGLSRQLSAFLAFAFLLATPGEVRQRSGTCWNRQATDTSWEMAKNICRFSRRGESYLSPKLTVQMVSAGWEMKADRPVLMHPRSADQIWK